MNKLCFVYLFALNIPYRIENKCLILHLLSQSPTNVTNLLISDLKIDKEIKPTPFTYHI